MHIHEQIKLIQDDLIRSVDVRLYDLTLRLDTGYFKALVTHKHLGIPVFEAGVVDAGGQLIESERYQFSKTLLEHVFMESKIESDSGELQFITEELIDQIAYRIDVTERNNIRTIRQDSFCKLPVWVRQDLLGAKHYVISNADTTAQTYIIKHPKVKTLRLWIGLSNLYNAITHPIWNPNHARFTHEQIEQAFKYSFQQTCKQFA